ncbi:hypothetical protein GCM10010218_52810 [Streptomyces mashuensis]|uniref:AMP-dependent synthetase/ligase domain-containing protein n=1 Tax=Streptomyces mashuensis TaxID=33904 RepID=A0A919B8Z5_9ACTN|nr:AMP-binding protein [Streptomyces mashuensis]GHF64652.1 hypothetical protein GCM10010218_52810 [Streptomyces mashuensis]
MSVTTLADRPAGPDAAAPAAVPAAVARHAAAAPARTAVRAHDGALTYAGLDRQAGRLAGRLRALGVRAGDCVAVCLQPSARLVVAQLAVLKAGAGYLTLDPRDSRERHAALLGRTTAGVVITQELYATRFGTCFDGVRSVVPLVLDAAALAAPAGPAAPPVDVGAGDAAYFLPVGGEALCVPHRVLTALIDDGRFLPVRPGDVVLQHAPFTADGTAVGTWAPLAAGARLVVAPPGDLTPRELADLVAEEGVTVLRVTARTLRDLGPALLPGLGGRLRCLVVGGGALTEDEAAAVRGQLPGTELVETEKV